MRAGPGAGFPAGPLPVSGRHEPAVDRGGDLPLRRGLPRPAALRPLRLSRQMAEDLQVAPGGPGCGLWQHRLHRPHRHPGAAAAGRPAGDPQVRCGRAGVAAEQPRRPRALPHEALPGPAQPLPGRLCPAALLAVLGASTEAFRKQAEGASQAARRYMEDNDALRKQLQEAGGDGRALVAPHDENESLKAKVEKLKEELAASKRTLEKAENEVQAMRRQAEGLTREYDRLLDQHARLQAAHDGPRDKKEE
ncbi:B-cell receptor-associated protein 31 isoform X1 [Apteryx mantelli]|uniref:Endoplasmic reticulum transmembrane protein n=1 Tax=Apteryx mantelli TaxID=2696672 RepID=A0ABM4G1T4_9AVES